MGRIPISGIQPFEAKRKMYQIVRCSPEHRISGTFLCREVAGFCTHWIDERTVECVDRPNCDCDTRCPFCAGGSRKRWAGYFAYFCRQIGRVQIGEAPAGTVWHGDTAPDPKHGLRGIVFHQYRMGQSPRSRVGITLAGIDRENLPPSIDVETEVRRIINAAGSRRPAM